MPTYFGLGSNQEQPFAFRRLIRSEQEGSEENYSAVETVTLFCGDYFECIEKPSFLLFMD